MPTLDRRILIRRIVSITITFLLLGWAICYISRNFGTFKQTLNLSPYLLAGLSFLVLLQNAVIGCFNRYVLGTFGVRLVFREWFGLGMVTTLGNYLLPPRGGAGLRAAYLYKKHGLSITRFLSIFIVFNLMCLAVSGIGGLLALSLSPELGSAAGPGLWFFFGLVSLGSLTAPLIPLRASWFDHPGLRTLARLVAAWQDIKGRQRQLWVLGGMLLVFTMIQGLMIYAGYRAMGLSLGADGAAMATALFMLSSAISVTPGGLGFQEAALLFSTQVLGIAPAASLAVAVTLRGVIMFWTFLLGPIFSWLLFRRPIPKASDDESPIGSPDAASRPRGGRGAEIPSDP